MATLVDTTIPTEAAMLPASKVETLFGSVNLRRQYTSDEHSEAILAQFGGARAVLETIAHGRMLNEIAIHLEVPMLWFNEWVERNIPGSDVSQAYILGAESWMVKAHMCLSIDAADAAEAAQSRALASEFRNMAEKLDPQRWGAKKSDALTGQVVNIALNMGSGQVIETTIDPYAEVIEAEPEPAPELTGMVVRRIDPIEMFIEEPTDGW